ncbi:MAG: GHMP kinase [Desulfobacteraceae bacterium]|nr:MAG: GHMP kinase [Desulfobacteraceae bacterium]
MEIIRKSACARAGLLGNPSDGYNGKTIAIIVRNFQAEVILYEWDSVDIIQARDDRASFRSIDDLLQDVRLHGYYGGIRLIKATIKRFVDYCRRRGLKLHDRNFSIRYQTGIPRQVGLAGSSSIIVATLGCLMEFYGVKIPLEQQPSLVLSVETEELGISAGLQDRVIQCYGGMVYMDFDLLSERKADGVTFYAYERLDPALLPSLYLSYHNDLSEPTETFHNDIRGRYNRGETLVVDAMRRFAELTVQGRIALLDRDTDKLSQLIDENFNLRCTIYKLPDWQMKMVETARGCGASAKFAGSGGAIIGIYRGEAMFEEIRARMAEIGSRTIKPIVTTSPEIRSSKF